MMPWKDIPEICIRLIAACVLGGLIGYQRERIHKPAGLKTHIVVCVSSALVILVGEFMYQKYGSVIDPSRLGAQVISGLGFLGAGAIIKDGFGVRGLTTAASIWTVSCIGLACGAGFYVGALIATTIIFLILIMVRGIEKKSFMNENHEQEEVLPDELVIHEDDREIES